MKRNYRGDLVFLANGKPVPSIKVLADLVGLKSDTLRKRFDRSGSVRYTTTINEFTITIETY